jgi:hypothetical protein
VNFIRQVAIEEELKTMFCGDDEKAGPLRDELAK